MRTLVALSVLAVTVAGCKAKPKHQPPPTSSEVPTGSAAGNTFQPAPDLKLPKGDGTPPVKLGKPLDKDEMTKLTKPTYPGFGLTVRGNTGTIVEVRQLTNDHPKIAATVTAQPCFDCVPMEIGKWKEKLPALKELLAPELRDLPDTVFEVGDTELNGQTMIYTYQIAQHTANMETAYTDAYALYYNDGVNQIRVVAEFKDDPTKSVEIMGKMVSKNDLEGVAKAFMDAYTHVW